MLIINVYYSIDFVVLRFQMFQIKYLLYLIHFEYILNLLKLPIITIVELLLLVNGLFVELINFVVHISWFH